MRDRHCRASNPFAQSVIVVIVALSTIAAAFAQPPEAAEPAVAERDTQQAGGKKLALLVTIGDYSRGSGWHDLNSENDRKLMREVLIRQGFEAANIHEVRDPKVKLCLQ